MKKKLSILIILAIVIGTTVVVYMQPKTPSGEEVARAQEEEVRDVVLAFGAP